MQAPVRVSAGRQKNILAMGLEGIIAKLISVLKYPVAT